MSARGWVVLVCCSTVFLSIVVGLLVEAAPQHRESCVTIGGMERCRDEASKVTCWKARDNNGGIYCLRDEVKP